MANFVKDFTERHPELVSKGICKRAESGIHFGRGSGMINAIFTGAPMHYIEGNEWKPIDTALQEISGGWYGCPHSDFRIHLDGRIKHKSYEQYTELPGKPIGKVDGDKIIREFEFGVQRLIITETGFRQETEITRPPSVAELAKLIAMEKGKAPGRRIAKVYDAKNSVDYSSIKDVSDFLKTAQYPVIIDPNYTAETSDFVIYGLNAVYATARSTSAGNLWSGAAYCEIGQLLSGSNYYCYRTFQEYDTSSIGFNVVTQVNLHTSRYSRVNAEGTPFSAQIIEMDWVGEGREDNYDNCLAGSNAGNLFDADNEVPPYTSANLTPAWVKVNGNTQYGIRSSLDKAATPPTDSQFVRIDSADSPTPADRPYLAVLYRVYGGNAIIFT